MYQIISCELCHKTEDLDRDEEFIRYKTVKSEMTLCAACAAEMGFCTRCGKYIFTESKFGRFHGVCKTCESKDGQTSRSDILALLEARINQLASNTIPKCPYCDVSAYPQARWQETNGEYVTQYICMTCGWSGLFYDDGEIHEEVENY